MKKLKTGDVVRFNREKISMLIPGYKNNVHDDHEWVAIHKDMTLDEWYTRMGAVEDVSEYGGLCIAKILKMTPKTVTVQIIK